MFLNDLSDLLIWEFCAEIVSPQMREFASKPFGQKLYHHFEYCQYEFETVYGRPVSISKINQFPQHKSSKPSSISVDNWHSAPFHNANHPWFIPTVPPTIPPPEIAGPIQGLWTIGFPYRFRTYLIWEFKSTAIALLYTVFTMRLYELIREACIGWSSGWSWEINSSGVSSFVTRKMVTGWTIHFNPFYLLEIHPTCECIW